MISEAVPAKEETGQAQLLIEQVGKVFTVNSPSLLDRLRQRSPKRYVALEDVNLTIASNTFVSIIGPSGCGKSTLLNLIAGLDLPTSGQILLDGQRIRSPGPDRGIVFQNYALMPWMTALENVIFAVETARPNLSKSQAREVAREHLELVGLTKAADRYPGQISGGMKQRVAIARALSIRPKLLLMDEPFGALDALTRGYLQEEVLRIWEANKLSVVLITHSIDEALLLSDRIVVMSRGPRATIREVIDLPAVRPRQRSVIEEDERFVKIKLRLEEHLFNETRAVEEASV
ncbi:ABC transporter ATP-binding protein [Synechococcus elongatus]|uniref:MalK-like protein n=2 Tax=Synechococcus elongatus TaxID=32046 RepID=O05347_SYNE7|nr:ABC transporter ATP-binding protein [Synechococcus elongatus]ABB58135.1 nitrate transport ATP-binding subunits C and D [Synechococcus elongatus PCC 7942 = FACHB-805]AJD57389.1 sulfate ABC transporter ATP-binding protein [Synechococcus elongatus UTEX 2973]MBD2586854.1 ABC transporter ATP-binding protein [Synechococcus elongatus FACHB-242]MBD2687925.1 ABC transporter ATP-binding protein [Synechococcus elongatus FACHB-1061]MBD2706364.1 ABC transporter ATP-binding protein [Synechococcus elongat